MKSLIPYFLLLIPLAVAAQGDTIQAGVYNWKRPDKVPGPGLSAAILFEGSTRDMSWLQMSSNTLDKSENESRITVPENQEYLFIVKKGVLSVSLNDTSIRLVGGSIALLMPGQKIFIQNKEEKLCAYYIMKYRGRLPVDAERGKTSGGSFIKDWTAIPFRPHDKGGIRNYFERPTAMTKRMEMHVTTLNAGIKSHDPHTHRAAEIVLMIEGNSEMQIGNQFYEGSTGSVYYLPSDVLHAIRNKGTTPCTYFAFQFE